MPSTATVVASSLVTELPGRGQAEDIQALVEALAGPGTPDGEAFLATGLTAEENDAFAEDFLAELLLRPPIPAGCAALLRQMHHDQPPPWQDHEVVEDRAGLWTAHAIAHAVAPSVFSAPALSQAVIRVTPTPSPRAWKRPRARTLLAAHALAGAPSTGLVHPVEPWAFDTLWFVGAVEEGDAVVLDIRAPLPALRTLETGLSWDFEHSHG